jgi:hypothetical protein
MVKIIGCIVLGALSLAQGSGQGGNKPSMSKDKNTFATNVFWQKGGLGVIHPNLHIVLNADKNKLLLAGSDNWIGQGASTPEVAIFYQGKIWSSQALPNGFDLAKAIVISFEAEKIRFFDFGEMTGGYYKRLKQE